MRLLPPAPKREYGSLDGLRAVAALSVLLHHAGFDSGFTFRNSLGDFTARGDIGVPIFFALSGFLLFRPFLVANLKGTPPPSARAFWWRRLLRIVPAYWLALTVCAIAFGTKLGSVTDAIWYYSLGQIYSNRHALGGLPQAWSLCTEISFYVMIPLYARATRRLAKGRAGGELVAIVGLAAVSFAYRSVIYIADPSWAGTALFWLPAHLEFFAVGMAAAWLCVARSPRADSTVKLMGRLTIPLLAAAIGAFVVVAKVVDLPKGIAWVPGPKAFQRQFLYAVVAACLLLVAVFAGPRSLPSKFLGARAMAWLGTLSYGIYLWHKSIVEYASKHFGGHYFDARFATVVAVGFVGSVVLAALSWRFFERPLERFKNLFR